MPADANASAAERKVLDRYEAAEDPDSLSAAERKPAEVPPTVPAEVAAVEPPKHPKHLLRKAKQYGLDDADLAELSSDELREEIADRRAERSDQRVAAAINAAGRPYDPATGQLLPANTPAGVPPASPPGGAAPPAGALKLGMTAEEVTAAGYGPELHGVVAAMVKPLLDEIARLGGQTDQLSQAERGRGQRETLSTMDRWFGKHADVYGEGSLDDLDPEGREFKMRMRLIRDMGAIPAGQRSATPKQDFDKVHKELASLFPAAPKPAPEPAVKVAPEANGTHNRIGDKFKAGGVLQPKEDVPPAKKKKGVANAVAGLEARIRQQSAADGEPPEEDDLA